MLAAAVEMVILTDELSAVAVAVHQALMTV